MKKTITLLTIILGLTTMSYAQVAVTNDGSMPDNSAMLDIKSTDKGVLVPRMTSAERDAIASPANGLLVFVTDNDQFFFNAGDNSSPNWTSLSMGSGTGSANSGEAGIGANYGTVVNNNTGKVWIDRNLGSSQVATSLTDALAYGDLYQWGRAQDGHEKRISTTVASQATTWIADNDINAWNGKFIMGSSDWIDTPNGELWKGLSAENNPCPSGFRIPTNAEWIQECLSWTTTDLTGGFASALKIPAGGRRSRTDGSFLFLNTAAYYWSSTASANFSRILVVSSGASLTGWTRATGASVRCIKD